MVEYTILSTIGICKTMNLMNDFDVDIKPWTLFNVFSVYFVGSHNLEFE